MRHSAHKTERGIVEERPGGFRVSILNVCQGQAQEAAAQGAPSGKPFHAKQEVALTHHHWVNSPETRITGK